MDLFQLALTVWEKNVGSEHDRVREIVKVVSHARAKDAPSADDMRFVGSLLVALAAASFDPWSESTLALNRVGQWLIEEGS